MVQLKFFLEYKRSAGIGSSAPATLDWISGREWMEYMNTWDHMPQLFKTPLEVVLISNFCSLNQRGACFSLQTQTVIYRNFTPKRAQQQKCTSSGKKINPTAFINWRRPNHGINQQQQWNANLLYLSCSHNKPWRPWFQTPMSICFDFCGCVVPNKQENCKIAATEKQNDTAFPLNQVALVVIWHHLALKAPRLLKFDVIK